MRTSVKSSVQNFIVAGMQNYEKVQEVEVFNDLMNNKLLDNF